MCGGGVAQSHAMVYSSKSCHGVYAGQRVTGGSWFSASPRGSLKLSGLANKYSDSLRHPVGSLVVVHTMYTHTQNQELSTVPHSYKCSTKETETGGSQVGC